ncbi:hypothetical protein JKF63_05995 [Porcisia hertigi]|uniref:Uncharacterized protein n=1 Tax=Porcisia hertigi TaxID=2761500 RepID=A0A836IIX4_9TRYP|nr:hypothetical protein JKF63_05995 [Porcisia hertigi]
MPNAELIPASSLPIRGANGSLVRPQGWRAARVIPLRSLPVVSEESKCRAKKLIADAKKKPSVGSAIEEEAKAVDAAKALLSNPSLPPSHSSCFLISTAVAEHGRVSWISTAGERVNTVPGGSGGGSGRSSDIAGDSRRAPLSLTSSRVKEEFNFSAASSPVTSPLWSENSGSLSNSSTNGVKRCSEREVSKVVVRADSCSKEELPFPSLPSPHKNGAQPAFSVTPGKTAVTFAAAGLTTNVVYSFIDEKHSTSPASCSLRPSLLKDSRFRRKEDNQNGLNPSVAQGFPNGGVGGSNRVTPRRMGGRSSSRITLLCAPPRTRWFVFNDSSTHEAQVSAVFCYQAEKKKPMSPLKPGAGKKPAMEGLGGDMTASTPAPGDLRILCRSTPFSNTTLSSKELRLQGMSSSSRSYVEVCPVSAVSFTAMIPTPATPVQEKELTEFKSRLDGAVAVEVFLVLAPGETVCVAEGTVLGYRIDTRHVPFDASGSMAVLGRMLTPELVRSLKRKSEAASKKNHRHTLVFLEKTGARAPRSVGLEDSAPVALRTGPGDNVPLVTDPAPLLSTDTLNPLSPGSRERMVLKASLETVGAPAESPSDPALTKTETSAAQYAYQLSGLPPKLSADQADAAGVAPGQTGARYCHLLQPGLEALEGGTEGGNDTFGDSERFYDYDAPVIAPNTAVARSPKDNYSYNYDYIDASAEPAAASTFLARFPEDATTGGAGTRINADEVGQLAEESIKRLVSVFGKDRHVTPGDVPMVASPSGSTVANLLSISF